MPVQRYFGANMATCRLASDTQYHCKETIFNMYSIYDFQVILYELAKEYWYEITMKYAKGVCEKSIQKESSRQDFYVSVIVNIMECNFLLLFRLP